MIQRKEDKKIPNSAIILNLIKCYWIRFYSPINIDMETMFIGDVQLIEFEKSAQSFGQTGLCDWKVIIYFFVKSIC